MVRCTNQRDCGDVCDRFCPCISMYPSLCTVFLSLLIASICATIFGLYAFISLRTSIFRFNWEGTWFFIINASFLSLLAAAFLLFLCAALWCVCSSYKGGLVCKTIYVLGLIGVTAALALCMVGAILIIYGASQKDTFFADELEQVWMHEINVANSTLPCRIQHQLQCHGFEKGDCQGGSTTPNFTRCGTKCREQDIEGRPNFDNFLFPGCREAISKFYTKWNAVLLAGTSLACILSLISLFVTCTSVSFEKEK